MVDHGEDGGGGGRGEGGSPGNRRLAWVRHTVYTFNSDTWNDVTRT